MSNVILIIIDADMLETNPGVLVRQAAGTATDEGEISWLSSRVIIGCRERRRIASAAERACNVLHHVRHRRRSWSPDLSAAGGLERVSRNAFMSARHTRHDLGSRCLSAQK